jgi:hypothetical protein
VEEKKGKIAISLFAWKFPPLAWRLQNAISADNQPKLVQLVPLCLKSE